MDHEQFSELALAELHAVHRLAYHLSRNSQEADDFVQETYLRAFKYQGGFQLAGHGTRPWLFKILHTVVSSHFAKERRRPTLVADFDACAARPYCGGGGATGEPDWDGVDQRLKTAICSLPFDQRTVFLLSAVEGLRYQEIADVLSVPVLTVGTRLFRARQILSAALSDLAGEMRLRLRGGALNRQGAKKRGVPCQIKFATTTSASA